MSYNNLYYSPEDFGLTAIGELEYSSGSYEFDTRVVWQHSDGRLFTARDSGCSCPSPFEDYTKLEDLDLVGPDFEVLMREEHMGELQYHTCYVSDEQLDHFLDLVKQARKSRLKVV